ncbi:MAG TPA: ATP-binding protein [Actinomycetota bacterium]|nr:ATP-binding protein [Actinomycetota bacterium]
MPHTLLLCDTADGLSHLQYALIKSGGDFQTEVVTDGFRAVEIAARTQPHVVVVEIGLEGLAGAELVRRLIATVPETRVICWTGVSSPFAAAEMIDAGATGYLLKEDGPDAVIRAIAAVLRGNVVLSPRVATRLASRLDDSVRKQRELETVLAQTSERLDRLTTVKADFLANVSHELRTPVTIAKGIAYVLKNRGIPEEERREFLDQLESSLERLMRIVDELVTIAEIDRGTLSLKRCPTDLAPLLRHVIDEVRRQYPAVAVDQQIPPALPSVVDPVRISEVARQILDNACRYSPEDRPVTVRARSMDEGVVVSVTDHGQGIDRGLVTQVFSEPFSTGEEILRKERSGVGVGLHMARQLVLQHGGIIWADPLPAGGTRVSFCIPAQDAEPLTEPPDLSADAPQPTASSS